ncbi:MAG: hypothetical protein LIP09_13560 [Bacteroidales bacterium]|nr:hypothetical protein [Bacteroidales bacterium]
MPWQPAVEIMADIGGQLRFLNVRVGIQGQKAKMGIMACGGEGEPIKARLIVKW